jgi:O-antigen/teichoic acid export membrane protein
MAEVGGVGGHVRRLLSASVLYAFSGLVQQAAGFLLIPVYTRRIAPPEYGVLELLTAFLSIAVMCVTLGLTSAINKVYHRDCDTDAERDALIPTALAAILPMMAAVGGGLMLGAAPLAALLTGSAANAGVLRLGVASALCAAAVGIVLGGLRAKERSVAYVAVCFVQLALALGLNLLFVLAWGLGIRGVLSGNLIANLSALVLALVLARGAHGFRFERRLVGPLFAFGLAIMPNMMAGWVMDVSDRYLLRLFRDLGEVAQYGVGYKFGMAVQVLVTWPFQLAWPALAFAISREEGHEHTYARVLTYLVLVVTVAVLGLLGASHSVIPSVVGAEYAFACTVVPVIGLAYACNALQHCIAPGIHIGGRTRQLSGIGAIAAAVNLGLGLLMIPTFGAMGAAWATVGAYALSLAGALRLAQRSHPVDYEWGRLARVAGAGLVGAVLMILASRGGADGWIFLRQAGALGAFLVLLLGTGFVDEPERRYLTGLLQRHAPTVSR